MAWKIRPETLGRPALEIKRRRKGAENSIIVVFLRQLGSVASSLAQSFIYINLRTAAPFHDGNRFARINARPHQWLHHDREISGRRG